MTPLICAVNSSLQPHVRASMPPEDYVWFDVHNINSCVDVLGYDDAMFLQIPFDKIMVVTEDPELGPWAVAFERYDENQLKVGAFLLSEQTIYAGWLKLVGGVLTTSCRDWIDLAGDRKAEQQQADFLAEQVGKSILRLATAVHLRGNAYKPGTNRANPKRIAKGKKPMYDWHTVVLEPPKPKQEPQGGHHASPRAHDRRGHFKNYKSGKRVWFAACTVNKSKPGFIFKDYTTRS